MKTCVYSIAKNEKHNLKDYIESVKDSDYIVICDTGSNDGTYEELLKYKEEYPNLITDQITVDPWRFDKARNKALRRIPEDVDFCITLDLDERLCENWKEILESKVSEFDDKIHRIRYDYTWSWNDDGTPDVSFFADRIHSRVDYRWKHPCHETLYPRDTDLKEKIITIPELKIYHYSTPKDSRSDYLSLLKLGVEECPDDDRIRHYYARELMFRGKLNDAIEQFKIHVNLPSATWRDERSASFRYMSECYYKLNKFQDSLKYAVYSAMESPSVREPWLQVAKIANQLNDWNTCYWACSMGLSITTQPKTYLSNSECWGYKFYDYACISSWNLGLKEDSAKYAKLAYEKNKNDERLKSNCEFFESLDI